MVNYPRLISSYTSSEHHSSMANPIPSTDQTTHSKQTHQSHKNKKTCTSPVPACNRSNSAAIDIVILIAVLGACGFLVFPYVNLFCHEIAEIGILTFSVVKEEVVEDPIIYAFLGVSFLLAVIAVWGIVQCVDRKCDNPNCLGLRKAAEFDIQVETEECLKNSNPTEKGDAWRGLFELSAAHHSELEAELKKIAPPNGRAVLVFRARCGCSVGKMEVWGTKRLRKKK